MSVYLLNIIIFLLLLIIITYLHSVWIVCGGVCEFYLNVTVVTFYVCVCNKCGEEVCLRVYGNGLPFPYIWSVSESVCVGREECGRICVFSGILIKLQVFFSHILILYKSLTIYIYFCLLWFLLLCFFFKFNIIN